MLVVGFGVLKLSFEKMFYNKHDVLVRLNRKAAPVFSQLQNMLNKWFWRDCEIHWHYDDFNEGLTKAQRNMLLPPSAFGPDEATEEIWRRAQNEQAELKRLRKQVADSKVDRLIK